MSDITLYSEETFENIKHINDAGQEYWLARELQPVLEYARWENFNKTIDRAIKACSNTGFDVSDHFREVTKMVSVGSGAEREIGDIMLSRYACYLIVMNGDPNKEVIAVGQTYFAVKTRQQELIENYTELSEDQKRLAIRSEMKRHNAALADAAHDAGVIKPLDYAIFQNYGYMGLYGSMSTEYQISTEYENGFSLATTMGVKTTQNDNSPPPPVTVPDEVTEEEKEPSFWKRAGEVLDGIGEGLEAVWEGMADFAAEHPFLAGLAIAGSLILPGPQFGFI